MLKRLSGGLASSILDECFKTRISKKSASDRFGPTENVQNISVLSPDDGEMGAEL